MKSMNLPSQENYIGMERWGKDHWSVFAYLEARAEKNKGIVDNQNMRCNSRLHRGFAHSYSFADPEQYPTRLKGGKTLGDHDDWSCAEDLAAFGLIELFAKYGYEPFGSDICRVVITEKGYRALSALKMHKQNGGLFSNFSWSG